MEIVSNWTPTTENALCLYIYACVLVIASEYPAERSKKDADGVDVGVAGSVNLLQNVTLSTQPIASLDWSPDKQGLCVCSGFDQSVRVIIVTKLNTVWRRRRATEICTVEHWWSAPVVCKSLHFSFWTKLFMD